MKQLLTRFSGDAVMEVAVTIALALAVLFFAWTLNPHYPIVEWLFFHYASYWLCVGAWALACFGLGCLVLERLVRVRLPIHEHGLFAFTLGLLGFEWSLFLLGALQAYDTPTFFLLPLLSIAASQRSLRRFARRVRGVYASAPSKRSLWRFLAIAFGCAGLAMVYFTILTPDNVQFDSRWKHMALAEDYVAHGGIRRSTEGWMFAARPHITSYLYAWAFLVPWPRLFDKILLAAHLEFFTFAVSAVLGVSALVRRLVPRADPSAVWAARFLFPGVFLYDSSVSGGTDHFGALYAAPIALATLRACRALEPRFVGLLAALLAGAVMVKETAALLLVPFPVLAVGAVFAIELARALLRKRARAPLGLPWLAPLVAVGVGLLVSAPFWFKNLVLYGDPLYPQLHRFFPAEPWSEAAAYKMKWAYDERQMWAPSHDLKGVVASAKAMFSYSFDPNDWARNHGNVPVFGSLFTLLLLALAALRGTRRVWFVAIWVHVGIFAWYWVHHQDRYLQGIVPLMAAVVAATLLLLWRSFGTVVKLWVALLVGLQVVWGGDVYFIQTHAMIRSPIKRVNDLLSAGYEGKYSERFATQGGLERLGESLPERARVLFHEQHPHLGIGAESVLDSYQWQHGIDYGAQGTPEGVRRMLREQHGITHVHYQPGRSNSVASLASDILFAEFATRITTEPRRGGGGTLAVVPDQPSRRPFRDGVVVLSCRMPPETGLYRVRALDVSPYGPKGDVYAAPERAKGDREAALALLPEVDWVVVESRCFKKGSWPAALTGHFELGVKRRRDPRELWRRLEPAAPGAAPSAPAEPEAAPEGEPEGGPEDAPE